MSDGEKLEAWRAALAAHVDRLAEKHVRERQAAPEAPPAEQIGTTVDFEPEQQTPQAPPEGAGVPEDHRRLSR